MSAIYCDTHFGEQAQAVLRDLCAGHELRLAQAATRSNLGSTGPEAGVDAAEIILGQPSRETLDAATGLRWVHVTSAGYARYATDEMRAMFEARQICLTNSSSVYAIPCAEQALAGMMMLSRRLDLCVTEDASAGWPSAEHRRAASLVTGSKVLILGFGAIAQALADRLRPFGVDMVAVRRHPSPEDPIPTIHEEQVESQLAEADFVVNLLPGGSGTQGYLSRERISAMKPGAFLVNVGRGTTVDQDALVDAMSSGQLGGAYLDVTDPEPLPAEHPLWRAPRTVISPHVAGGHRAEMTWLVRHFGENLRRFSAEDPLLDRIY